MDVRDRVESMNAQVEADVVPIAARVGGVVKATKVHDNQLVKAGAVLFELAPADLDVEVARTAVVGIAK